MKAETETKLLVGKKLLKKLKELQHLSNREKARQCGYSTVTKDNQLHVNIGDFLNAVLEAKGISSSLDISEDEHDCIELARQDHTQSSEVEEESIWRGVFTPINKLKVLFSKNIEIEVGSLPTWKPRVVIENYRLEDDE